jgi:Zn-dependent peptidase ImmA (M78 family)/transcriptional regulator with XRE-family HTH domain
MDKFFYGDRLREAREIRKLSQEDVARITGITRASISAFEKELRMPNARTAAALSNALAVPLTYLQNDRPARRKSLGPLSYRKKTRASVAVQNQISRYEEWLEDIAIVFSGYIEFPEVNLPLNLDLDYKVLTSDDIEQAAEELRKSWGMGLGPIANLIDFVEANGIFVGNAALNTNVDAVSKWRENQPRIVINQSIKASVRLRMNIAHELGHLVLHRLAEEDDYEQNETYQLMERQAAYFAGCFLFPRKTFCDEFFSVNLNSLMELKKRWKISMGAIVMRGKNLNLISDDMVTSYYRALGNKGYSRTNEPLDNIIPIEKTTMFLDASQMISKIIPLRQVIDETLLSTNDFLMITGIPEDFIGEKNVKILQFKHARHDET